MPTSPLGKVRPSPEWQFIEQVSDETIELRHDLRQIPYTIVLRCGRAAESNRVNMEGSSPARSHPHDPRQRALPAREKGS